MFGFLKPALATLLVVVSCGSAVLTREVSFQQNVTKLMEIIPYDNVKFEQREGATCIEWKDVSFIDGSTGPIQFFSSGYMSLFRQDGRTYRILYCGKAHFIHIDESSHFSSIEDMTMRIDLSTSELLEVATWGSDGSDPKYLEIKNGTLINRNAQERVESILKTIIDYARTHPR